MARLIHCAAMVRRITSCPKANGVTGKSGNASEESLSKKFGRIANRIAREMGRARAFMIALGIIVVWAVTGPVFLFSDT